MFKKRVRISTEKSIEIKDEGNIAKTLENYISNKIGYLKVIDSDMFLKLI